MLTRIYLCFFFLHVSISATVKQVHSQEVVPNSIPRYLQDCYSQQTLRTRALRMPATMGTLISLLQKVERNQHTEKLTNTEKNVGGVLDARVMSYSILHRFRFDGIEQIPEVPNFPSDDYDGDKNNTNDWGGVIPYAATGLQFKRYKILFGQLIPGNAILFPNSTLQPHEKCALHFMLSSTVNRWERGDEGITCRGAPTMKPTKMGRLSECPLEDGVAAVNSPYSSRSDTISPGTVIAGIAAALQLQEVPMVNLMRPRDDKKENKVPVGDPSFHSLVNGPLVINTWAATLAGDLSEVAVFQGPYKVNLPVTQQESVTADIVIGADGWWGGGPNVTSTNDIYTADSRLGRWYYLMRNSDLEFTDAEIRGGIDGLLLGSAVLRWSDSVKGRLRLSQILEMYYSEKGVSAYGEPNLKWCNRFENFLQGSGAGGGPPEETNLQILLSQTMSFARILYEHVHTVQFDDYVLEEFVEVSMKKFERYLSHDIDYQHCINGYYGRNEELPGYPFVDLYVVTDGSWIGHNFSILMSYLAEEGDVSLFGSRISVMNGRTAEWLVEYATSAGELTYNLTKEMRKPKHKNELPGLDIVLNLVKMNDKINERMVFERIRNIIKGIRPQVVLFMAHRSLVLGAGPVRMSQAVNKFRKDNPDVHLVFASVDSVNGVEDPFSKLGGHFVKTIGSRPSDVVPPVISALRMVPGRMIAYNCDGRMIRPTSSAKNKDPGNRYLELEDYLTPGEAKMYRLHPMYFKDSQEAKIVFVGSGYGVVSICMTRHRPDEPRTVVQSTCRTMSTDNAEFVFKDPCPGGVPYNHGCLPIYFKMNVTKTYRRCTEDDCRFPDQVRFSVWQQNIKCNGAAIPTAITTALVSLLFLLVTLK